MNKQIYIHVGAPKTATTFFQKKVFNTYLNIRDNDKEGLLHGYENNKLRNLGQKLILNDIDGLSLPELQKDVEDIFAETEQDKILLSEESFMGLWAMGFCNGGNIAIMMKQLFPNARILLGIREQYAWLQSLYDHCLTTDDIRTAWKIPPPENFFFLNSKLTTYKSARYIYTHANSWINWNHHYNKYTCLFGEENVFVLPYELLNCGQEKAESILDDFLQQPSMLTEKLSTVVNKSKPHGMFGDEKKNEDFREYVRELNRESNQLLDKQLPSVDLKSLGYY